MFFGLSVIETLVVSFFVVTSISCIISYIGSAKIWNYFEEEKILSKAVNKLRRFDQYILSKLTLATALFYFITSFFLFNNILLSDFSFFFACLVSFVLNIITTFFSRINYCYVCNFILETKLNELDCFMINFKHLATIYIPFILSSFIIPCVYLLDVSRVWHYIMCAAALIGVVCFWVVLTPKIIAFLNGAKKMEKNHMLRYRMEQLFIAHGIKKYELYCFDTSRSKEANAMVSGIGKYHLFVSSYLIESVTLPELESIVTHEIGHIKNNHLRKMMVGKAFMILSLIFMVLVPSWCDYNDFYKILFYILTVFVGVLELIASISVEKKYELEADSYANAYSDPSLFASALKKVVKYEDEISWMDELFQTHPNVDDRIKNLKDKE